MKLASLKNNTRDGQLVVVNQSLTKAVAVPETVNTMQQLLDNWSNLAPLLQKVYDQLNSDSVDGAIDFDQNACESPLPRAYQWADGSAYVNHVELVRKARNAAMPETFWTDPLMYQGGSDAFLGPRDKIVIESTDYGIDMESEVAVIVDDTPMAASPAQAQEKIRLFNG